MSASSRWMTSSISLSRPFRISSFSSRSRFSSHASCRGGTGGLGEGQLRVDLTCPQGWGPCPVTRTQQGLSGSCQHSLVLPRLGDRVCCQTDPDKRRDLIWLLRAGWGTHRARGPPPGGESINGAASWKATWKSHQVEHATPSDSVKSGNASHRCVAVGRGQGGHWATTQALSPG